MRDDPASVGVQPYGAPATTPTSVPAPTGREKGVMGSAALASLLDALGTLCMWGHLKRADRHAFYPLCQRLRIGAVVAAGTRRSWAASISWARLARGWLTDRYDRRKLLLCYYGLRGVSLLILPFVRSRSA